MIVSTKEEVDAKYLAEHAELERSYYKLHELTKEEFDALHADLWNRHYKELLSIGDEKTVKNCFMKYVSDYSDLFTAFFLEETISREEFGRRREEIFDGFENELFNAGLLRVKPPKKVREDCVRVTEDFWTQYKLKVINEDEWKDLCQVTANRYFDGVMKYKKVV